MIPRFQFSRHSAAVRAVTIGLPFVLGLVLTALQPEASSGQAAQSTAAWPDEISGATRLPTGLLLLVDDEERRRVFLLPGPGGPHATPAPTPMPLPISIDDLEAATIDSVGNVYLLASHSVTKKGKFKPARRQLLRLGPQWIAHAVRTASEPAAGDAGDTAPPPPPSTDMVVVRDLLERLDAEELEYRTCNLEGLAWYPAGDRLLFGARSPQHEGRALVFAVGPVDALFAAGPVRHEVFELELGGRAIRGMEYDPWRHGCLVLAGPGERSGGFRTPDFAVYLWRPGPPAALIELEVEGLAELPQPEAIVAGGPVDATGTGPVIIATEGRPRESAPVVLRTARPRTADEEPGS